MDFIYPYIVILQILTLTKSSKILLLPFPWRSHVFELSAIGEALIKRGHDVSIMLPPSFPNTARMKGEGIFDVIEYKVTEKDFYTMDQTESSSLMENLMNISPIEDFRDNINGFQQFCTNPLSDDNLFQQLRQKKFDLAVVDGFPCTRCYYVIPYRLNIPHITHTSAYEPWLHRIPALPSIVPFPLAQYFTNEMSSYDRLFNFLTVADWSYDTRMPYLSQDFTKRYISDKHFKSLEELARETKLLMYISDFLLDYARPMMPHEINIGGLSTKPANPLSKEMLKFIEGGDGFIVVSFGSYDVLTGEGVLEKFVQAFETLSQKVVLRTSVNIEQRNIKLPSSVKIMTWIPQNDLLGHPNCRLFITHCGANGQFEALYHAVPMLGFPIFADQPYNARRVAKKGFGLYMNILDFTAESLASTITSIIHNESYYENIEKASMTFRSRDLSPRDYAAHWIEQVLSPGGVEYLRPTRALQMPWYEYLMLDIFLLLFCLPLAVITATACGVLCYCCTKRYLDKDRKNKTD